MKPPRILTFFAVITGLSVCTAIQSAATESCSKPNIKRADTYYKLSTDLNLMSDEQLSELLKGEKNRSNWGENMRIEVDGAPVFVKSIALTDLEREPNNMRSTRNVFGLPQVYQYGVGSAGFGVWRELAAHIMTTKWVLSGECPNFPLLYHWRVLPGPEPKPMNEEELKRIKFIARLWENEPAVRAQLEARHNASARVVLFIEYFPEEVFPWLINEFAKSDEAAVAAVKMVFSNIEAVTAFMRSHSFAHLDFTFRNMLTDGKQIYLTDFGLSTASVFELSDAERTFLKQHEYDDLYRGITGLVNMIIRERVDKSATNDEKSMPVMQEFADGRRDESLPPFFQELLARYARLGLIHSQFMDALWKSKSTPYPASELEQAYQEGLRK